MLKRWKLRQDLREAREMLATADPMPIAGRAKGVRSLSRRTAAELVDHLWSRAAPLPHGCGGPGIYALFHGNELVYIGQAVNVAVRIGQHFGSKTFTAAAYISVPRDRLNQVERVLLDALVPRLNRDSSTQLRRRELSSAFQADTAMCDTLKEG